MRTVMRTMFICAWIVHAQECRIAPDGSFCDANLSPIERRSASTLSEEEFWSEYHARDVPVIITNATDDWPIRAWDLDRVAQECSETPIMFYEKKMKYIAGLPEETWLKYSNDTKDAYNMTMQQCYDFFRRPRNMRDIVREIRELSSNNKHYSPSYLSMAHYFWPPNIYDKRVLSVCPALYRDIWYPRFIPRLAPVNNDIHDKFMHPRIFAAPANSRAYPAHLHGQEEYSMILVLEGSKHFVHWDKDQAEHLYPLETKSRTETEYLFFMANPFRPSLDAQPNLRRARGHEGVVRPGEILFVPRGIHIIHNPEEALTITFVHQPNEKYPEWTHAWQIEHGQRGDKPAMDFFKEVACVKSPDASIQERREVFIQTWGLGELISDC